MANVYQGTRKPGQTRFAHFGRLFSRDSYIQFSKNGVMYTGMKRFLGVVTLFVLIYDLAIAGTDTLRYRDIVFSKVKVDSVVYSTENGPLYMDVYQPVGDTARQRPLVILAHGGSFMHGTRHSHLIPAMCRELAMRGFVAVSIDYRLTNLAGMVTRRKAYASIIKAVADGRSSVRWFINDAGKSNTFGINPGRIFFGGSSAGGILAEQLVYNNVAKCSPVLCKAENKYLVDTGALPPHAICGCISLAGAVLDTNLIGPGGPPILHIQGDADHVVPFGYKRPIHGLAPFRLAGLGGSRQRYLSQRIDFSEYVFSNLGHTPWDHDKDVFKIMMAQVIAFANREMK
jgi:para-nitrobenzyl esterase